MIGERETPATAAAQRRLPLARCGLTALVLVAAACKGPAPVDLGADRPSEQWNCRPAAGDGWNCVQNAAGAPAAGASARGPTIAAAPTAPPQPTGETHRQLAYRPERATPVLDLPGDYYALQLAVRDSREALERFAEAHRLGGLPHVRVARRGGLAYALLAGVYRDRDAAERARDSLPKRIGSMRPWIRSLRSLQRAMLRADALTGSPTAHTVRVGGTEAP